MKRDETQERKAVKLDESQFLASCQSDIQVVEANFPFITMATSVEIQVPTSTSKFLESALNETLKATVKTLAVHYGFDESEALKLVGVSVTEKVPKEKVPKEKKAEEKKEKKEKPTIPLPWTNEIKEEWCHGLRVNHGLFTQCPNEPAANKGEDQLYGKLCSTCLKQCEKNAHGKPNAGLVTERDGESFVAPNGKKPVAYASVMKKLNLSREQVEEEAGKFGFSLTEAMFAEEEKKRGRPAAAKEEKAEKKPEGEKKRGRPAKEKKKVSVTSAEELLEALETQGAAITKRMEATANVVCEEAVGGLPEEETENEDVFEEETENEDVFEDDTETVKALSDSESGSESESDEEEYADCAEVEIEGKTYLMIKSEAEQVGSLVYNEEGEEVGRYAVKNGKPVLESLKKTKKVHKK